MPVHLHRAERTDALVAGLAELLAVPPADPFARDLVVVPAAGVERWVSQSLAHVLGAGATGDGVCAAVDFRSPRSLAAELVGAGDDDPWAPDALVWPLLEVVDAHGGEAWCRVLGDHLGHGREGEDGELRRGRRYAVALRLARLFASYAVQRPGLLADWECGRATDGAGSALDDDLRWQAELWRRVVAAVGAPSPRERHAEAVAALRAGPGGPDLPPRLSLFGHTRIAATEAELLAALGAHREVHLWLPHPSPTLWTALSPRLGAAGAVPRGDDPTADLVRHPLLASLGRDLRELQRTLVALGPVDEPPREAPAPGAHTLLGWLQGDLVADAVPAAGAGGRVPSPTDDSVQVHACHGPARQVEVLREVLLGLLQDDPTLQPRDVVVMCPDIETFAPLVEAAFGLGDAVAGGHPGQRLQVRLADRALVQTNPLLGVVSRLLDLAGGRAEASAVLDLLAADPVRRRFRFSEADLETVAGWVDQAGVRWGFDAPHRAPYGLDGYVQNTWRFGLDRVLAGVALSDDSDRWVGATLPLDDVGSTAIDLAGRLAEAVDRLQRVTDRLRGRHPLTEWVDALAEGVAALTATGRGEEWQEGEVRRELTALRAAARDRRDDVELRLADVRALMSERLAGRPTRANFRTGTLTVCTMVPMRSVPHRVVCLLGLDDGVFPRAATGDGDDVLARRPLTGERDPRSEDRQLLLDALLAAREHLVVTYSGAHETTGQPRPPAVPLQEVLDALDRTAPGGAAHAVRRHPLQDFGAADLAGDRPFSFDPAALAGARAAAADRVAPVPLSEVVLPTRPAADVELDDLVRFLCHPVRTFLRDRLEVAPLRESDEVADGLPVELDHLRQWEVGSRLLADLVRGRSPERAREAEWRRGVLPPGQLGWQLARRLLADAGPVADVVDRVTQGRPAQAIDVDVDLDPRLGSGRRLRGTVTGVHGDRLVVATFSRLGPRQWLETWVPLLALAASHPGRTWTAGGIGRGERGAATARVTFVAPDDATELLADLVALRDRGLDAPLALPLKTAHAWAAAWRPGVAAAARSQSARKWASNDRFPGEDADAAHVAVWGERAPLDVLERAGLAELAGRLWTPMLERRVG